MLKHIPIFWKLNFAFIVVLLIVFIVNYTLSYYFSLNGNIQTLLVILVAIFLICYTSWFILHFNIKPSLRELSEGMHALAEKNFDVHLDENKKGEFSSLASSFNDVADIISSFQTELKKSRDHLKGIVESTSDIIITVSPLGKILTFNTGAEKALGYYRKNLIGKPIEKIWADPSERNAFIERLKYGDNVVNLETQFLTKTGEIRDVLLTLSLMRNPSGDMIGTFGISKDITEVKRLQNQLLQSQRYIAIGEVFTGIQHSLKNMLNACKGGSYMVRTGLAKDERKMFEEGWAIVEEGINRMTKMSSDMLKYVKEWIPKMEKVDLAESLTEIDHVIKKSASNEGIDFQMNISPELPSVKCDAQMIHSTVMDIVSNALDACLWKDYDVGETPRVTVNAHLNNGKQNAIIEVKDNGCGMSDNVKSKIFTPFFSTKSKAGTGLGLAIASRMIHSHDGKIEVESAPDQGTTFQIILPIELNNLSKENHDGKKSSSGRR